MSTLAELVVVLDVNAEGLQRGFTAAQRAAHQLGDRMQNLGAKLSLGVSAPLALLGASFVKAAADMDSLTRGLTAVTGSASATQAQLRRLQDVAKLPGLGFREAIQGSINLQAAGLSAATSERALRAFGNALATVGKGKADLDGVILALGQIASKGKVSAEEINQLAERVPQIRQAMIAAFGSADTELLGKAGISATQFINGVVDQLLRLPQASGGAANAFENLSDAAFRARAAIGDQLLPAITPLVDGLATMLSGLTKVNPETLRWAIGIGAVAATMGPLIALTGTLTEAVGVLAAALGIAGLAGTIATGGVLLVLGALSALFVKNKLDALAAASAANTYRTSLIGLTESQLIAQRIAESTRLSDARIGQQSLRNSGKATFTFHPAFAVRGSLHGASAPVRTAETPEMRRLSAEATEATARVAALTQAIDQLHTVTAPQPPPLLPADTSHKLTDAERAAQALADKMRQIQIASADAAKALLRVNEEMASLSPDKIPDSVLATAKRIGHELKRAPSAPSTGSIFGGSVAAPSGIGKAFAVASEAARSFAGSLGHVAGQVLGQFTPLGLAFQALDAVIRPLQPLIDALLVPFTIMGEILATLIVPVLRLLFQPLKLLGIVVSYIGEVIAKVAGAIATAIGSLVRGIGRLVNKLPGSPGDPLVKAGQAMVDLGAQFRSAADDMAAKRKELQGLSFDDALANTTDAANRLSEALINAAEGFKIERFRFGASDARTAAGSTPRAAPGGPRTSAAGGSGNTTTVSFAGAVFPINIPSTVSDPVEAARLVIAGLKQLALSNPEMNPVTGLLPG